MENVLEIAVAVVSELWAVFLRQLYLLAAARDSEAK
jgi:hypothetical protein